jgi:hypothetical protein
MQFKMSAAAARETIAHMRATRHHHQQLTRHPVSPTALQTPAISEHVTA